MVQNFNGLTFFEIFKSEDQYFDYLEKEVKKLKLAKVVDENGESDNIFIRKLYWILKLPVIEVNEEAKLNEIERPNIIQYTLYDKPNRHILDPYLRLIAKSSEYRLSDLVANFKCFKTAFDIQSSDINEFLNGSHFQTFDCIEISSLQW